MTASAAGVRVRPWLRRLAPLLLVPLIGYGALALVPDLRQALAGLTAVAPLVLVVAAVLEAGSLAAFSAMSAVLLRPGRTPRYPALLRIDLAVYGLGRVLPAAPATGGALRLRMLTAAGAPRPDAVFLATAAGPGSALLLHLMLGVALLVSIPLHGADPLFVTAATVGVTAVAAAFGVVLALTGGGRRTRRAIRAVVARLPLLDADRVDAALVREAEHLRALGAAPGRLAAACAWGAANWLLDAAALGVVLAGAGFVADPLELFVCYALAGVLGVLPLTPGGIGVVEGVLVPALVGFGAPVQTALIGVLGWRLVSFWLPIPVGAAAWLGPPRRRRDPPVRPPARSTPAPRGRPRRWPGCARGSATARRASAGAARRSRYPAPQPGRSRPRRGGSGPGR